MTHSTNGFYQKKVRKVGEGTSTKTKKLMPYHPQASRNRPKESMENTTGKRFGRAGTLFCWNGWSGCWNGCWNGCRHRHHHHQLMKASW